MADISTNHALFTVSTVAVFVETMRFISENDLWEEAQSHLENSGKKEMFVDYEAFHMLGEVLINNDRCNSEDPVMIRIPGHLRLFREFIDMLHSRLKL